MCKDYSFYNRLRFNLNGGECKKSEDEKESKAISIPDVEENELWRLSVGPDCSSVPGEKACWKNVSKWERNDRHRKNGMLECPRAAWSALRMISSGTIEGARRESNLKRRKNKKEQFKCDERNVPKTNLGYSELQRVVESLGLETCIQMCLESGPVFRNHCASYRKKEASMWFHLGSG